ncbi:hypothetical protein DM02DRAFT_667446 [Periconia macrospinosa]|uniref:Mating-type protein MAT-1 n=1 Tax=Periconia macrospinosa TaxID=97972 RepID=A0A2V1E8S2_9PLEO|nr:hypothetical protein DM02DRAFT_667446 [Periconia macrospinosa]
MASFAQPEDESAIRQPTSLEISQFIASRTPQEMAELMHSVSHPAAHATLTAALLHTSPREPEALPEKNKKALNAFVGFRCYYLAIPPFKPWPMKKLSKSMSTLWETDPNKAIWNLMGKAWSIFRDQVGKDRAPLREFFEIVCPRFGIPPPEVYLQVLGWSFIVNADGNPQLVRTGSSSSMGSGRATENEPMSVADIISIAQQRGYAAEHKVDPDTTPSTFIGHTADTPVVEEFEEADTDDMSLDAHLDAHQLSQLEDLQSRIAATNEVAEALPPPSPSSIPGFDPRNLAPGATNFNDPIYNLPDYLSLQIIQGAQEFESTTSGYSASMTGAAMMTEPTFMTQPAPMFESNQMYEPSQLFEPGHMVAPTSMNETTGGFPEDPQDMPDVTFDMNDWSAFKAGANSDVTLPAIWQSN